MTHISVNDNMPFLLPVDRDSVTDGTKTRFCYFHTKHFSSFNRYIHVKILFYMQIIVLIQLSISIITLIFKTYCI